MRLDSVMYINGITVVSRNDLAVMINCSTQTIVAYHKEVRYENPLQKLDNSISGINGNKIHYDLMYALKWHQENIKVKYTPKKQKNAGVATVDIPSKVGKDLSSFIDALPPHKRDIFESSTLDPMDKLLKLEDIEKKEIQNKVERGSYIDINDVDKNMATLAIMMLSSLRNYEKSAPILLDGKSKDEILSIVKDAHYEMADRLDELVNMEWDSDETLYDVVWEVVKNLSEDMSPSHIIKAINK